MYITNLSNRNFIMGKVKFMFINVIHRTQSRHTGQTANPSPATLD